MQAIDAANAIGPADNDHSRAVYAAKPNLPAKPSREDLIAWLTWCDGNGCWSDVDNMDEYGEVLSYDDLLYYVGELCES